MLGSPTMPDVGHDPALRLADARGEVVRDDALLVVGLVEHPARCRHRRRRGSRRGARGVRAGRGVEAADAGRPALLQRHAAVGVDAEAGAAHRGHERRGGREVGGRDRAAVAGVALVAAVAGGEVEADALDRGLREDALRGVPVGRRALTEVAVRVGDDVGLVPVDEVVERGDEVDVVAALRRRRSRCWRPGPWCARPRRRASPRRTSPTRRTCWGRRRRTAGRPSGRTSTS